MRCGFLLGLFAVSVALAERVPYLAFEEDPYRLDYESAGDYGVLYLLDSVRDAVVQRDWPRAVFLFGELRKMDAASPDYTYAMAQLAFWQMMWAEVIGFVDALPPDYEPGDADLLKGGALVQLGRPEDAVALFQSHIARKPESSLGLRWAAETFLMLKRYEESAAMFRRLLAVDPSGLDDDPPLKEALTKAGSEGPQRWDFVLQSFTQDRTMNFLLPPLHVATINFLQGNRDKAIEVLRLALGKDPSSPELNHQLGLFYDYMGRKREARECLDKAAERAPTDADIVNNRGVLAMYLGDDDVAIESFRRALEIRPAYPEALRNLSRIHFHRREWKESIHAAKESLVLDTESATARLMGAFASYKLGYHEDVLRYLEPLLRNNTQIASAWFLAGNSAQALGKRSDAERYFREGLRRKPNYVLGLNNLADLLVNQPSPSPNQLREALSLAENASALTGGRNPVVEQTLREARERSSPPTP